MVIHKFRCTPRVNSGATVYINDLVVNLESDVHLFADDTSLLDCFDDSAESNGKIWIDFEKKWKMECIMESNI